MLAFVDQQKIHLVLFTASKTLKLFAFEAFYGPVLVTIVLVAKICVDRSFSELWKPVVRCFSIVYVYNMLNLFEL